MQESHDFQDISSWSFIAKRGTIPVDGSEEKNHIYSRCQKSLELIVHQKLNQCQDVTLAEKYHDDKYMTVTH